MRVLKYLFLSILFSLPFWLLAALVYLPIYLAPVQMREIYLSVVLFLLLIYWGGYGLFVPFLCYFKMRKKGIHAAWKEHVYAPLYKFYPITLGVALSLWVYVWVVSFPLDHFQISPPKEMIFLFAFILFVAEGFKISQRKWELKNYRELEKEDSYPLQLSPKTLDLLVYLQSPVYLFFYWGTHFAGFYLLDQVLSPYLSRETMMFVYVFTMLGFTLAIRIIGRKLEDIGRIEAYIPWQSKY